MKKKKGAAHLEMVLSFVFFMTFVSFLFLVLKPYDTSTLTGNVVTGVEESFLEETQTNYSRFFLKTRGQPGSQNCFKVGLPAGGFRYALTEGYVKDIALNKQSNSELANNEIKIDGKSDVDRSFSVIISSEFQDTLSKSGCNMLGSENYTVGSIFEKQVISLKQLQSLKASYESDYESLKRTLNIPEIFDFTITSEELPSVDMQRPVPDSSDVIVTERLYEVLDDSGKITNARFVFSVW